MPPDMPPLAPAARAAPPILGSYGLAVIGAAAAVAVAWLAERALGLHDLSMVFLMAVVAVASVTGRRPAMLAAGLCFLGYNFFFIEPRHSFHIDARQGVVAVVVFLVAALLAGRLASRLRNQLDALREAHQQALAQSALREKLAADLENARVAAETERLRSALLSSVSHDLRSPLAAIIGSASSLEDYGDKLTAADRASLLETIRLEGQRLDRYVQNLLDMTRLGHGDLPLRRDWIGVGELVGSAVGRLRRYRPDARFELDVPADLPPIWVHPALLEQALFNVLENAATFSPAGEAVRVRARLGEGALRIEVSDRGPGIPEAERERIFDMFFTVGRGDRGGKGTGLGLTICQGMVGAHGGSVEALPGEGGIGTCMRITLPLYQPPEPT